MLDLTANLQPKTAASAFIRDADENSFERDVLAASMEKPVIVDFWAPWCGPCKQMMPLIEKAVNDAQGAVILAKVNVDANPGIAQALRIQSVPTVYAFFKGRPVDGFSGAQPESAIRAFVEKMKVLSGPQASAEAMTAEQVKKLMGEADQFFQQGKCEDAMARFAAVLDADGDNMEALGGIGWCLLTLGDAASARDMLAQLTPEQLKSPRLQGLSFILSLGEKTAALEPQPALEQKLEKNPKDLQARFDLAQQYLAAGALEQGIDALVTLTRQDREWQDKKARIFLLDVFDALGSSHPLTLPGRRKLSSVLFS